MRLLADRIVTAKRGQWDDEEFRRAQVVLRLPAPNHAPVAAHFPLVDRFVLSPGFLAAYDAEMIDHDPMSRAALMASFKPLMPQFWVEYLNPEEGALHGWLFDGDVVHAFFYALVVGGPVHLGSFSHAPFVDTFAAITKDRPLAASPAWARAVLKPGPIVKWLTSNGYGDEDEQMGSLVNILKVVAMIGSRRTAVTRRIIPADDVASRALHLRRAQIGRPVFSYNQVDLVLPKTCVYRGELRDVASFDGVRGHMVIGHWRLIDHVLEPFWTWIDGHERGDKERGWIVKNRIVQFIPGGERRGFTMPTVTGIPGERRKAKRSQSDG